MDHLLLRNLCFSDIKSVSPLEGYSYDKIYGAWIADTSDSLLVSNSEFSTISTKKKDIETGEDQK